MTEAPDRPAHPTPDDRLVLAVALHSPYCGDMVVLRERDRKTRWIASSTFVDDLADEC